MRPNVPSWMRFRNVMRNRGTAKRFNRSPWSAMAGSYELACHAEESSIRSDAVKWATQKRRATERNWNPFQSYHGNNRCGWSGGFSDAVVTVSGRRFTRMFRHGRRRSVVNVGLLESPMKQSMLVHQFLLKFLNKNEEEQKRKILCFDEWNPVQRLDKPALLCCCGTKGTRFDCLVDWILWLLIRSS